MDDEQVLEDVVRKLSADVVHNVVVGFVAHVACENSADDEQVLEDVVRK